MKLDFGMKLLFYWLLGLLMLPVATVMAQENNVGIKTKTTYDDPVKDGKDNSVKNEFVKFDAKGNKVEEVQYDDEGEIDKRYTWKYDAKGQKTEEVKFHPNGKVARTTKFEYDAKGNRTAKLTYDGNGKLVSKKRYVYEYY